MRDATILLNGTERNVNNALREVMADMENTIHDISFTRNGDNTDITIKLTATESFINQVEGDLFYSLGRLSDIGVNGVCIVPATDDYPQERYIRITP